MIMVGTIGLAVSGTYFLDDLKARIYPNGTQKLATTCYVDEKTSAKSELDGYFVKDETRVFGNIHSEKEIKGKEYVLVVWEDIEKVQEVKYLFAKHDMLGIIESSNPSLIKIRYSCWVPQKDFYKYPTKEELAQMYRKVMK